MSYEQYPGEIDDKTKRIAELERDIRRQDETIRVQHGKVQELERELLGPTLELLETLRANFPEFAPERILCTREIDRIERLL